MHCQFLESFLNIQSDFLLPLLKFLIKNLNFFISTFSATKQYVLQIKILFYITYPILFRNLITLCIICIYYLLHFFNILLKYFWLIQFLSRQYRLSFSRFFYLFKFFSFEESIFWLYR